MMNKEQMELYLEAKKNGLSHKEAMDIVSFNGNVNSGKGKVVTPDATTITYSVESGKNCLMHVFTFDGIPSEDCKNKMKYYLFNYNGKNHKWFGFVGCHHDEVIDEILAFYGKKKEDFIK